MEEPKKLFSITEAAEELRMTPAAVRTAIYRKALPVYQKYGRKLITEADLEEYRMRYQTGNGPTLGRSPSVIEITTTEVRAARSEKPEQTIKRLVLEAASAGHPAFIEYQIFEDYLNADTREEQVAWATNFCAEHPTELETNAGSRLAVAGYEGRGIFFRHP